MAYITGFLRVSSRVSGFPHFAAMAQMYRRHFGSAVNVLSRERETNDDSSFWGKDNIPSYYHAFKVDREAALQDRLQRTSRFQSIGERDERSTLPSEAQRGIMGGKYFTVYRGMDMMKGPLEFVVYMQMLWQIKPSTVIELGTYSGASAIWMADVLKLSEVECNIYSADIDLSLLHTRAKVLQPPNVTFLEGDCNKIENIFPSEFLARQPHPWIIFEDSHEGMTVVLEHFHSHMTPGDYIVCEDTAPDIPNAPGSGGVYDTYVDTGFAKLNMWKGFLAKYNELYAIDTFFTDLFGYNTTSHWDGFAKRIK